MRFSINSTILNKFPNLIIGVILVKNLNNAGEDKEISERLEKTVKDIREDFTEEMIKNHPKMIIWQNAYKFFGAKDKTCSVENLYRMILEGKNIRQTNKLADMCNFVSIDNMVPIGGYDLGKVDGNITLTMAKGDEKFQELGEHEISNPEPGEIIYRDAKDILCRRWNWRECEKTKITEDTKCAMLVIEGLPPTDKNEIVDIVGEIATLIEEKFKGEVIRYILSASNSEIEIHV